MKKNKIIKKIKNIIYQYGSFSVGEVEADCSPCIGGLGRLVALAEYFGANVTVNVYDPNSHSSDEIDSYTLEYDEINKETLSEILELAKNWLDIEEENLIREN